MKQLRSKIIFMFILIVLLLLNIVFSLFNMELKRRIIAIIIVSFISIFAIFLLFIYFKNQIKPANSLRFSIELYQLLTFYVVFNQFILSLQNYPIWDTEKLEESISIQWTIFGISVTVFILWYGLINNSFSHILSIKEEKYENSLIQTYHHKSDIVSSYKITSNMFYSVLMITINLVILIFANSIFFNSSQDNTIIEIPIKFSFYFSTSTILILILNIINQLYLRKKVIKEMVQNDLHDLNLLEKDLESLIHKAEEILDNNEYNDKFKKEEVSKILNMIQDNNEQEDM